DLPLTVDAAGGAARGICRVVTPTAHDLEAVPSGYLVAPPELPRDAPRLDVAHPLEIHLLPGRRHEPGLAAFDRGNRRLGQRGGVDVPLVGQPRFDDGATALRVGNGVGVRLDLVDQIERAHHFDDALACDEAI